MISIASMAQGKCSFFLPQISKTFLSRGRTWFP